MSELPKEIADALDSIPADLVDRYSQIANTIKEVERLLFERSVFFETAVEFGDRWWLSWREDAGEWRLYAQHQDANNKGAWRPAVELPLSYRIRAVQYLPRLIRLIAETGRMIR